MIRNVRLGHGLFDLIRQERLAKKVAMAAEKKKSLEAARNQWQAAKDSSSEESEDEQGNNYYYDEDLAKDEDLENYFGPSIPDKQSQSGVNNVDEVATTDDGTRTPRSKISSAMSRATSAGRKKKAAAPRPFTPQHNSLTEVTDYNEAISRDALFRQLCALNWILDSMNLEQGSTMAPISTSWSHLKIGGTKIDSKRANEERRAEKEWDAWLNNQQRIQKKVRVNRLSRGNRLMSHPRVSLQSTSISPSSSSSQVNNMAAPPHVINTITNQREATETSVTVATPDDDEALHRTGIFKFLDEYYDSLRPEEDSQKGAEPNSTTPSALDANMTPLPTEEGGQKKKKRHREGRSSKKSKSQDNLRFDSPEERNRSRFILKDLRNDFNYKPRDTAEMREFHANKASRKYATLRQDLHNKFKEVQDDKAMTLHDVLEQMERERLTKCQNKFRSLQTNTMSFHRAVVEMREEGERMVARPEDMRRQSSFKGNWYTELLHSMPLEIKEIWFYRTILSKLGRYGLVENTSKQSVYKFLKVLSGLRHWEICAPDVSAAVEFCRARIVDMSVDEYEEWFSQTFPTIPRPKTAPAGGTESKNGGTAIANAGSAEDGGNTKTGAAGTKMAATEGQLDGRRSALGSVKLMGQSRVGLKSAVSVADGGEGRRRLVQSAMVRRRR